MEWHNNHGNPQLRHRDVHPAPEAGALADGHSFRSRHPTARTLSRGKLSPMPLERTGDSDPLLNSRSTASSNVNLTRATSLVARAATLQFPAARKWGEPHRSGPRFAELDAPDATAFSTPPVPHSLAPPGEGPAAARSRFIGIIRRIHPGAILRALLRAVKKQPAAGPQHEHGGGDAEAAEAAHDAVVHVYRPRKGGHTVCAGRWPASVTSLVMTLLFSAVTSRLGGPRLLLVNT